MIELTFQLSEFIQVNVTPVPIDTGWPIPSPFNLRFNRKQDLTEAQNAAISGPGIYMISKGVEVVYVGSYRPATGNIIADRWGRHLQTITGRGHHIGFGGRDPNARLNVLIDALSMNGADGLREAIRNAFAYSQQARFRDTGYNTTPNRLRFASENWGTFANAQGNEILEPLTFWFLRIGDTQPANSTSKNVRDIERKVLEAYKPICNKEYTHSTHSTLRQNNTVQAITDAIREAARTIGEDITHRVQLTGV